MDRFNLLYYFPKEADVLYKNDKKSSEFKEAKKTLSVPLGNVIINGMLCKEGSFADKLHTKYTGLLKYTLFFAVVVFVWLVSLAVSSEFSGRLSRIFEEICIWLMIPAAIFFPLITVQLFWLYSFKYRILNYYLESYTPRCIDYPDNLRDEIAKMGFDMFQNQEEIQGYEDFPEEFEDDEIRFENCVCAACKSRLKCDEVTDFDDYSAICPKCGEKAVIPDAENDISDVLLSAVHEYWFENC